jgi:hypothetical protein
VKKVKKAVPCKYCREVCDASIEIIGYHPVSGEAWHLRCHMPL